MVLDIVKLEKLKIGVYTDRKREGKPQDTFEVMFNPDSFSMKHQNVFQTRQGINTSGSQALFSHSRSDRLSLKLILDGTGVSDFGLATLIGAGSDSVSEQIKKFLNLCFYMDGDIHQPKFLKIQWGDGPLQIFDCRLDSVDIKYTSFEKGGAPLRAELTTIFIEDKDASKLSLQEGKSSPDLTHSRTVKEGDTLPLLCKKIYGSSAHYIRVAQANNLDGFRNLTPGHEIVFPPLEK
ncbi:hypothetical protein ACFL5F_01900 [Planctomycetota bacterium]